MNILVTGGAGCIGSDLAARLLERGDRVTVVDNLSSGKREHIECMLDNSCFRFIEGDLLDVGVLNLALPEIEMVYHLAANPDVKYTDGDDTALDLRQNILATYNVLEAMREHGVRKLAFSSTSAVYGLVDKFPIREDAPFPHPISLYGATKLSCEAMISAFQNLFDYQCWIFRFANIVGEKVRSKGRTVIADFIVRLMEDPHHLKVLGNGKQSKSYLLSHECVDAMLYIVDHANRPLNTYNIGCDDWLTVQRIAELVVETMGLHNVEFHYTGTEGGWPGDVPRFRLDVSALDHLGWKARHTSEQAVSTAIQITWDRMKKGYEVACRQ